MKILAEPSIPSETFARQSRSLGRFRSSRLPSALLEFVMLASQTTMKDSAPHLGIYFTIILLPVPDLNHLKSTLQRSDPTSCQASPSTARSSVKELVRPQQLPRKHNHAPPISTSAHTRQNTPHPNASQQPLHQKHTTSGKSPVNRFALIGTSIILVSRRRRRRGI